MSTPTDPSDQRAAAIHDEIAALGPCLPGTISARMLRCGNPNCRCRNTDTDQRHGPYLYWTRKIAGKTASKLLNAEQAERYQPWLANDKRLHQLVRELETLAIQAAHNAEGLVIEHRHLTLHSQNRTEHEAHQPVTVETVNPARSSPNFHEDPGDLG